jgi:hypothetical protein
MRKWLFPLLLLAGCGAPEEGRENKAGSASTELAPPDSRMSSTTLTGLYESKDSAKPSQLCIVEKKGEAAFGLIVWGARLSACGGAGVVERKGESLRLRMTGDRTCSMAADIRGGTITIRQPVPAGCAYYCGSPARFDGAAFTRKGKDLAAAMKAKDPAGDPLCSG